MLIISRVVGHGMVVAVMASYLLVRILVSLRAVRERR